MTLRDLAIVMVIVLALPALLVIIKDTLAAGDRAASRAARSLDLLWTAVPVALLVVLLAFSVVA